LKKPLFTFFLAMLFITNAFASVREERIEKLHAKSKPLTAESAIETARFMVAGGGREYVSYSPDATRYVVRLARGDVKRDGVWIEVLQGLVDGKGGSASAAELVARLYSSGLGAGINAGPEADSSGVANPIKWIDNRTIAFLCSNEYGIRQVVTVDLVSKKVEFRTNHRTQIRAFDISTNQDLLFYASATDPSHVPMAAPSTGYVVPDGADALSIVNGYFDGSSIFTRLWNSKWFLQLADQEIPIGALSQCLLTEDGPSLARLQIQFRLNGTGTRREIRYSRPILGLPFVRRAPIFRGSRRGISHSCIWWTSGEGRRLQFGMRQKVAGPMRGGLEILNMCCSRP
jgi:hypothetical protein